jgi:hypothetical protein
LREIRKRGQRQNKFRDLKEETDFTVNDSYGGRDLNRKRRNIKRDEKRCSKRDEAVRQL